MSCGRAKKERSSQPPLTFLILVIGEHLEDSGGIIKEEAGTLAVDTRGKMN